MKQYRITLLVVTVIVLAVIAVRMTWRVRELEKQLVANKSVHANVLSKIEPKKPATQPLGGQKNGMSTSTSVVQQRKEAQSDRQPKVVSANNPLSSDMAKLLSDARAAMSRKAYDKAAEMLKHALTRESDPERKQQIRVMLGESLAASQDFDEAVGVYKDYLAAATSDEERVLGVTRMAAVLSLQKKFTEAEQILSSPSLIGNDPAHRQAIQHAQLRLWQSQPGRLDQVVTELEVKVASDPADRESLELLGTIYLKVQRNYDKAKPVYEKLLVQEPDNAGFQNTLIGIYRETRDYDKARDIYERYLAAHPKEADGIHFQIASLYIQSGKSDEGVAYAERHLNTAEATTEQKEQVARIYEFSGRLDDAAKTLRESENATKDAAKRTDLRFRQSDLLIRQKKYTEAEALVRRILSENSSDKEIKARANQELIRIYQVQGRVGEMGL
jgi:tetratricopeptide (TPR) repeat protein